MSQQIVISKPDIRQLVKRIVDEKGLVWLCAAYVEGSIGYYSPHYAKSHVESLMTFGHDFTERVVACFRGDALAELLFDIRALAILRKNNPQAYHALLKFVEKTINIDDFAFNATFSSLYP